LWDPTWPHAAAGFCSAAPPPGWPFHCTLPPAFPFSPGTRTPPNAPHDRPLTACRLCFAWRRKLVGGTGLGVVLTFLFYLGLNGLDHCYTHRASAIRSNAHPNHLCLPLHTTIHACLHFRMPPGVPVRSSATLCSPHALTPTFYILRTPHYLRGHGRRVSTLPATTILPFPSRFPDHLPYILPTTTCHSPLFYMLQD